MLSFSLLLTLLCISGSHSCACACTHSSSTRFKPLTSHSPCVPFHSQDFTSRLNFSLLETTPTASSPIYHHQQTIATSKTSCSLTILAFTFGRLWDPEFAHLFHSTSSFSLCFLPQQLRNSSCPKSLCPCLPHFTTGVSKQDPLSIPTPAGNLSSLMFLWELHLVAFLPYTLIFPTATKLAIPAWG